MTLNIEELLKATQAAMISAAAGGRGDVGHFWIDETAPRSHFFATFDPEKHGSGKGSAWAKPEKRIRPSKLVMAMIKGSVK